MTITGKTMIYGPPYKSRSDARADQKALQDALDHKAPNEILRPDLPSGRGADPIPAWAHGVRVESTGWWPLKRQHALVLTSHRGH